MNINIVQLRLAQLMLFALPFNGIHPLINLGELSREGFFYASIPFFIFSAARIFFKGISRDNYYTRMLFLLFIFCICSFLLNINVISKQIYFERSGIERYFTSIGVILYYGFVFFFLYELARYVGHLEFLSELSKAFYFVAIFLVSINVIEIASWYNDSLRSSFSWARQIVSSNVFFAENRIYGVSLEPSFNAFVLTACLPWVMWIDKAKVRAQDVVICTAVVVICVFSGSRTAQLVLIVTLISHAVFFATNRQIWLLALAWMILVGISLFAPTLLQSGVDAASSVSDVTRSYLSSATINVAIANPLGVGLGQSPFFVMQDPSANIAMSWELTSFYSGERAGELPPLYSWYARTMADLGIVQFLVLMLLWISTVARITRDLWRAGHEKLALANIYFFSQFLAVANSIDSFRMWQLWIAILAPALFIHVASIARTRVGG